MTSGQHRLRPMTMADIADAHRLSMAVGWPHRAEDWQFVLSVGRGIVATVNDQVVGTALWWIYAEQVARLGLVIVDPALQGSGIGKALMAAALAAIETPTVILNATDAGEPLYRRLGFEVVGSIMQYQGVPTEIPTIELPAGTTLRKAESSDLQALVSLDASAGGVHRDAVIAQLLNQAGAAVLKQSGSITGFAVCRRFGRGLVVGPVIARDVEQARALFAHWIAAKPDEFIRVDVPDLPELVQWIEHIGLLAIAPAITMVRGPRLTAAKSVTTFGLINQALG